MELKTFVTYMGLLFTAYNLNPEYKKFQIKLSSIIWKFIFVITLILLFLSSNELFTDVTHFLTFVILEKQPYWP